MDRNISINACHAFSFLNHRVANFYVRGDLFKLLCPYVVVTHLSPLGELVFSIIMADLTVKSNSLVRKKGTSPPPSLDVRTVEKKSAKNK